MWKVNDLEKIFRCDQYNRWKRGVRKPSEVKYVHPGLGFFGGWVREDVNVNVNSMCVEKLRWKTQ